MPVNAPLTAAGPTASNAGVRSSSVRKKADARVQIRQYLDSLPTGARRRLAQVRAAIRAAAPRAVEGFSYGIPSFRLDDRPLVWYAAFKHHTSLYPMTDAIKRPHAAALEGYETSKGTVRFPLDTPLPVALVRRLVKARIAESKTRARPRAG